MNLYLFTENYPYGNIGDTPFLRQEINYLSQEFNEIIVFPLSKDKVKHDLPNNVLVSNILIGTKIEKTTFIKLVKYIIFLVFNTDKTFFYLSNFRHYFYFYRLQLARFKKIQNIISRSTGTLFYSYWFSTMGLALFFANKKYGVKFISRAHGWDLYDDRDPKKHILFREVVIKRISKVYPISKHGVNYLKNRIKAKYKPKIELSYLGIPDPNIQKENKRRNEYRIISVARLQKIKNLQILPDILIHIKEKLTWVIIGDGPMREEIQIKSRNLPSNITIQLKGEKSNAEVLEYYRNNHIDLFVSLSISEGLPVSMMEAQSYGIPILSTNINGIPEIVNEHTGILIESETPFKDIAKKISQSLRTDWNTQIIQNHYRTNFTAAKNYKEFTNSIKQIRCE